MMKLIHGAWCLALLAGEAIAGSPKYGVLDPKRISQDIRSKEIERHINNFQTAADENGGNRAFGEPGYEASVELVMKALESCGRRISARKQPFYHTYEKTNEITLYGPDGQSIKVVSLSYNTGTPLPDGITAPLLNTPIDDVRGSGCFEDQWEGVDVSGSIALVRRGICAIADKIQLAKKKGALAVVLYNQEPGNATGATLGRDNGGKLLPTGLIDNDVGLDWSKRLAQGEKFNVTMVVDHIMEQRETWNVIAETTEGDPNSIIMVGAHLDSVQAGPGINDNGSGSSALLELIAQVCAKAKHVNKMRFAWWGAEELGLIGSNFYAADLADEEADKIRFYFNYDMIGSLKPDWTVYANTDADKVGASRLFDFLSRSEWMREKKYQAKYRKFGSSSDYVAFRKLGIAASGVFTGAGAPADTCYHRPCDTSRNVDQRIILESAKAAGFALAELASLPSSSLPRRDKTTPNPASKRAIEADFALSWNEMTRKAEKHHSCGGGSKEV